MNRTSTGHAIATTRRTTLGLMGATLIGAGRSARAAPARVRLMVWGGADRFQPRLAALQRLYPELATRAEVEVVSAGAHGGEVYEALRLALASGGDVPDLVMMNRDAVPEFAETGTLEPLGAMMKPYEGELRPAARQLATYGDEMMSIPFQSKGKVWFYREDLFQAASIDPAAVTTFEDYMAAGRRFREKHSGAYIMNIGSSPIHYWYFMILSHWPDVRVAERDGTYRITRDPRFAELLGWLKAWRQSGIAMPIDDWSPDWQPAFAAGAIGGSLISNWMTGFLPRFAPGQAGRWKLALWPEFNRTGSEAGGSVLVIPERSRNKAAAFEVAAHMCLEPQGAFAEWQQFGTPPSVRGAQNLVRERLATMQRADGMTEEQWAAQPVNYFGRDFMEPVFASFEHFRVFPYDPAAQLELTIMRRQTEAFLADRKSLEATLTGMEQDMKAQIGNPYAI